MGLAVRVGGGRWVVLEELGVRTYFIHLLGCPSLDFAKSTLAVPIPAAPARSSVIYCAQPVGEHCLLLLLTLCSAYRAVCGAPCGSIA